MVEQEDSMKLEAIVVDVDAAPEIQVGPGCVRRDLPSRNGVRIWIADGSFVQFEPHSRHRPRTLTGVRLFGFNLKQADVPS
jgi:hypothetical protein